MSSLLDDGRCLEAVPCNFLYKCLILNRAMQTLRFQNSFFRSEADEGALYIRDCPEHNVCRNILAKS